MKVQYDNVSNLSIIKEFPLPEFDFYDFCFDRRYNQILFCNRRNNCLMAISSDYRTRKVKCFKPLHPSCVAVSQDGYIFVGLISGYSYNETDEARKVIKMNRKGKICLEIKFIEEGKKLFNIPHRCTINPINNDIVVANTTGSVGEIVDFDSSGKLCFTYKGGRFKTSFRPYGLTCSPHGNIICCSDSSVDIHILSSRGVLLERIDITSTSGNPWSLGWDWSGRLMIGTITNTTGKIHIAEYTEPNSQ